jgi:hypothetical protein
MSFWASKLIDYVRRAIKTVVEALENINIEPASSVDGSAGSATINDSVTKLLFK